MARIHLFEFGDLPWFPRVLREGMTGYLEALARRLPFWKPAVPKLNELLARTGEQSIVDLCSGAGGPLVALQRELHAAGGEPVRVLLTDRYPNTEAYQRIAEESDGAIAFSAEPVDALAVSADLPGVRTLFSSFHHFRPEDAGRILRDAAQHKRPIAIFELTERRAIAIAMTMLFTPLQVLFVMPSARPVRLGQLFFTYLVPLIPLTVLWDATISCLRTYTADELRELAAQAEAPGYTWEIGRLPIPRTAAHVTYLLGYERR